MRLPRWLVCVALALLAAGCVPGPARGADTGRSAPSEGGVARNQAPSRRWGPRTDAVPPASPGQLAGAPRLERQASRRPPRTPPTDLVPPTGPAVEVEAVRSESLPCGLMSPMPGAFTAGYAADTGLDLAGIRLDVFAIAAGEVVYAEAGHTRWTGPHDTDLAVLLRLDEPIRLGDQRVTHAWYAHLSALAFEQPEGRIGRRHVVAGERLGTSGVANGAWHLHLGLLLDGDVSQRWGSFLLEDDVRRALCGLRARQRLPPLAVAR